MRKFLESFSAEHVEGEEEFYVDFIKEESKVGASYAKQNKFYSGAKSKEEVMSPELTRKLVLFYEFLKTIIIDSPYDQWFDISLGMRLNLVIPFDDTYTGGNLNLEQQLYKLLDEQKSLTSLDDHKDKKYNLDKVFLLNTGTGANERKYFCFPVEFVEYDLKDYWYSIFEAHDATTLHIPGVQPGAVNENGQPDRGKPGIGTKTVLSKDDKDLANISKNPWHPIMKNILELGSPETSLKYGFSRGKSNYTKNLHTPFKYVNVLQDFNSFAHQDMSQYQTDSKITNFDHPTLWSACKLINFAFAPTFAPDFSDKTLSEAFISGDWDNKKEITNETNKNMLATLQSNLFKKMAEKEASANDVLFQELLPIRESIFTTALIYRYTMENSYPQLTNLFLPTKNLINSFIVKMIKTFDGDYAHVSDLTKSTNELDKLAAAAADPAQIAWQFFLMVVQLSANTVDPTWKTPWLFPGPLTPIGIIAKTISRDWSDDDDESDEEGSVIKEACDEPEGYGKKPEE